MTHLTSAGIQLPATERNGSLIPTLNKYGWMNTGMVDPVPQFIEAAASSNDSCLDIGCAFGVYSLAALEAGAKVVALDIEQGHLDALRQQTPEALQSKLDTVCGAFPDVDLPHEGFGAILASRVFHFLDGPTLERAAQKSFDLIKPGGQLFVRVASPFLGVWPRLGQKFGERKQNGEKWPGWFENCTDEIDDELERQSVGMISLHLTDPEILKRPFEEAGFTIQRCEFAPVDVPPYSRDGRETVVLVAKK